MVISSLSHVDALSYLMMGLVGFIGLNVWVFAGRYFQGDPHRVSVLMGLPLLCVTLVIMFMADNLILFFISWCCSNLLLVKLMVHNPRWPAARASGFLALKSFLIASIFVLAAFVIFYHQTHSLSIQAILGTPGASLLIPLFFLLLGAMVQSAIWPFHRWLLSSLNSPTPVSALMHAGLINGGGFIIARFALLYASQAYLLQFIFLLGLLTAVLATLWKLMQSDMKRMLACSTMAQMGFMMVQCGLGLFSAAVAHLCWHGLFKAYLFLSSGGAVQDRRLDSEAKPRLLSFIFSLFLGLCATFVFSIISGIGIHVANTSAFLIGLCFITAVQFSVMTLGAHPVRYFFVGLILAVIGGFLYGESIRLVSDVLSPMNLWMPQPWNILYMLGFMLLVLTWGLFLFKSFFISDRFYVSNMNASQPLSTTASTLRQEALYDVKY